MTTYKKIMEQRAAEHMVAREAFDAAFMDERSQPRTVPDLIIAQRLHRSRLDFERAFDAWANRGYSETEEWPDGRP